MQNTNFQRIQVKNWQQFEEIDIEFSERLTILTGANGSGKTTILDILSKHFGWTKESLSSPKKNYIKKIWEYIVPLKNENHSSVTIGSMEYSNSEVSDIQISKTNQSTAKYPLTIQQQQNIGGLFIPSHRILFSYYKISALPLDYIDANKKSGSLSQKNSILTKSRSLGNTYYIKPEESSNSYNIKSTLLNWSIFGHGNPSMPPEERLLENYAQFEKILKKVLPKTLGFNKMLIKNHEAVLDCSSGEFIIDAASGGISAIIDLAWQIFALTLDFPKKKNTIIIDEVENHLHPTMQREVLPNLLDAFPDQQFIISSHSPLVIGSVKNSKIYLLEYNESSKVISTHLDFNNQARTASQLLDEVLGVSFTMPIWAQNKLEQIVQEHSSYTKELVPETFENMRNKLKEEGLEQLMPTAISELVGKVDDQN